METVEFVVPTGPGPGTKLRVLLGVKDQDAVAFGVTYPTSEFTLSKEDARRLAIFLLSELGWK